MNLSELSVRRGVTFSMLFIIIVGFGLFSLSRLSLDLYPDVTFPVVAIITTYDGVGPEEMENLISRPIEEAVVSVKGVKEVRSTSRLGASIVLASFNWGDDLDMAEVNLRKNLEMVEPFLPPDASKPITFAFDPSMQPIIFLMVSGPFEQAGLRRISEQDIEPFLERIPGIASADTLGGLRREIQVQLHPDRMTSMGVNVSQVVGALRGSNMDFPGGTVQEGDREYSITVRGEFTSLDQVRHTVVGARGMSPVRVMDVAQVEDTFREQSQVVRSDGQDSVMLMLRKQSDANTVATARAVLASLPGIEERMGNGVGMTVVFNQEEFITRSVGNLRNTALQGFVVTFLVLLFFLRRLRPAIIVATAIPVSVVATFAVMDQAGLTLNILSMAGLALAIGLLVDNSIVVQENIARHQGLLHDGWRGAINGAREVGMAISASTLTTIAVFVPVLFVPGFAGVWFRDMAITICFSLICSLFVALTLIPLLSSRLGRRGRGKHARPDFSPESPSSGETGDGMGSGDPRKGTIPAAGGTITREAAELSYRQLMARSGIIRVYDAFLGAALRRRWLVFLIGVVAFVGAIGVLRSGRIPFQFMPDNDMSQVELDLDAGAGTNLEAVERLVLEIEELVAQEVPEAETVNLDMGSGENVMALFSQGPHTGRLRLRLVPPRQRQRTQQQIQVDLLHALAGIPGLQAAPGGGNPMGGSGGDIDIQIFGHDLEEARHIGNELTSKLRRVDDVVDIQFSLDEQRPELQLLIDRDKANAMGIGLSTIGSSVSTAMLGTVATRYREGGDEYDILVRFNRESRRDRRVVGQVTVPTPGGMTVPVSNLGTMEPSLGPVDISRLDQRRLVSLSVTIEGRDLGRVIRDVEEIMSDYHMPEGFTYFLGGTAEEFQDSMFYLMIALLVAVFLVYMVMASQFESLVSPFIILFTVPLALIGVVAALLITDTALSVIAFIGIIMLCGIVVNNGIVMVDYFNQLRDRGMPVMDAVRHGAATRLRPVTMTATTTMLAMVPLALGLGEGAEMWAPMGRTVIGGLASATLLTLLVVPSMYSLIEGRAEKRRLRHKEHSGT